MVRQMPHADDASLQRLLFGDEDCAEWTATARHVETCEHCLARLDELSGSDLIEQEAAELLGGSADETADFPEGLQEPREPQSFDFLSPPSHPEMLGRLGRYEIERQVGAGGMGVVLKGFDRELNRPVAVKVLARHLAHSGAARQRFAREARAAAAVVHENVVSIHNVETGGEVPFLVMQFVAGESLQARVDRTGPLDSRQILRIGIQAAAGLAAAHEQGVIHRDVKPANILMEHGVERILLTDFGLARTVDDASLTHTGIIAGTPHYMSPEQAQGEVCDFRTDLFSLGSVMYFMATGHAPFRADRAMGVLHRICTDRHRPAWQINSELDDELSDLIDQLLQKKPSRRIASAAVLRETLSRMLGRIQSPERWWVRKLRRLTRTGPRLLALSVTAVALLIAATMIRPEHRVAFRGAARVNQIRTIQQAVNSAAARIADTEATGQGYKQGPGGFEQPETESVLEGMLAADAAELDQAASEITGRLATYPDSAEDTYANPTTDEWQRSVAELRDRLSRLESGTSRFEFPADPSP